MAPCLKRRHQSDSSTPKLLQMLYLLVHDFLDGLQQPFSFLCTLIGRRTSELHVISSLGGKKRVCLIIR